MNASAVPSKATIQGSFRSKSTLRTYRTYQKQFAEYCKQLPGVEPEAATPSVCTDFFHHLYSQGKTARTVDSAKTALVAFFHDLKVIPNPARDVESKQYVVGLQKYNKKNNIDDENKAHPLSVNELSCLPLRSFTKEMIRADRRKYSERLTLSKAFAKYVSYDMFESAYEGHTSSYSNTLSEVRKRKREGRL
ncbi:hypothetical protein DYB28_001868 [Aphanomyces astaci]|uniref:Core-binding (CB) domain-containing protein n=1 Tax=Aphanomyces astaci TaxID=112090 RepID=A0A9X8H738_APHAT|nr:hypothetical protein DYB28_001868 [Aphanomyces astaci]